MEYSHLDSHILLQNLQTGVVVHDRNTKICYANPKALELLRLTEDQAFGKSAWDPQWHFLNNNHKKLAIEDFPVNQIIRTGKALSNFEVGICDSSTEKVTWVLCNAYPELNSDKQITQIIVTFIDITSDKKNIPFDNIVELANDVIIVTDSNTRREDGPKIVYVNKAFTTLTGYSKEEVIGRSPSILQGEDTSSETRQKIRRCLDKKTPIQATILNYSKSGTPYWLDMNIFPLHNSAEEVSNFAAIERDVTEQKNYELTLKELSIRDPLTGLLNRRGFFEVAKSHFTQSKRQRSPFITAMIDIDLFKNINDKHGHDIGDLSLQHFSQLMQSYFRKSDIIARMGGEEFVILMTNSDISSCTKKLKKFLEHLNENPLHTEQDKTIHFTISVGLSQINEKAKNVSDILKAADKALYKAKNQGRNRVITFES